LAESSPIIEMHGVEHLDNQNPEKSWPSVLRKDDALAHDVPKNRTQVNRYHLDKRRSDAYTSRIRTRFSGTANVSRQVRSVTAAPIL
jgi:hypothetical protein